MSFSYPATSVFHESGKEVVAWSEQEYNKLLKNGHTDEKPNEEAAAKVKAEANRVFDLEAKFAALLEENAALKANVKPSDPLARARAAKAAKALGAQPAPRLEADAEPEPELEPTEKAE